MRVRDLLDGIRRQLFPPRRRRVTRAVPEVRSEVVNKLVEALGVLEGLAKKATRKARKGSGGLPPKARWYQLMTYTAQVLDGVLRNVEMETVEAKLERLEKTVDEIQKQSQQVTG